MIGLSCPMAAEGVLCFPYAPNVTGGFLRYAADELKCQETRDDSEVAEGKQEVMGSLSTKFMGTNLRKWSLNHKERKIFEEMNA